MSNLTESISSVLKTYVTSVNGAPAPEEYTLSEGSDYVYSSTLVYKSSKIGKIEVRIDMEPEQSDYVKYRRLNAALRIHDKGTPTQTKVVWKEMDRATIEAKKKAEAMLKKLMLAVEANEPKIREVYLKTLSDELEFVLNL